MEGGLNLAEGDPERKESPFSKRISSPRSRDHGHVERLLTALC